MWLRCAALVPVLLSLAAGCQQSARDDNPAGAPGEKLQIAVIPKGTTHEFWKSVHFGAVKAAKELGNVEIIWKGPLREDDRTGQINVVTDFVTRGVDGIVLAPLDSGALVDAVSDAVSQGIPVVIFDSALNEGPEIVTYVATDNYKGGAIAARRMAEALGGHGDVILLRYAAGSESTEQREAGFLDTLQKEFPQINILSSNQYAGTTPEDALNQASIILNQYREEADGIFAVCEPNAAGVLRALEQSQLTGKVKFVAFDPNADLIRGLESGSVHGIVLQDPVMMGYEAVKAMVRHIRGEPVEKRINTGEHVATPENMHEPEMQRLLKPPQQD
jgi:ribose transport system substrate-binding protein